MSLIFKLALNLKFKIYWEFGKMFYMKVVENKILNNFCFGTNF
jgi:hypothetical protein